MSATRASRGGEGTQAKFPSQTHWSLIARADGTSTGAQAALNELCRTYWFPIYAFIRNQRIDSHKAKDLTQDFFVHLLGKNLIGQADRDQGRFRSFLLASLTNYLKDGWRKEKAAKRGGGAAILSFDEADAEAKLRRLPASTADAAKRFDGIWAATVIEQATERLKHRYANRGKLAVYEALQGCLTGKLAPEDYPVAATRLGMTKETYEVNLSRFKDAFGKVVRDAIAKTVKPENLKDEIRYLISAWTSQLEVTPESPPPA